MAKEAGKVTVKFNAFNIPDSLQIKQGSKILYTTNGLISGYKKVELYHDPRYGEDWQIIVTGNTDTNTAWDLWISCPGENVTRTPMQSVGASDN